MPEVFRALHAPALCGRLQFINKFVRAFEPVKHLSRSELAVFADLIVCHREMKTRVGVFFFWF